MRIYKIRTGKFAKKINHRGHGVHREVFSDKWLTDAIVMFERCKASHIVVVEHGEKVGIIRADDILHTYRFNAGSQY